MLIISVTSIRKEETSDVTDRRGISGISEEALGDISSEGIEGVEKERDIRREDERQGEEKYEGNEERIRQPDRTRAVGSVSDKRSGKHDITGVDSGTGRK